MVEVVVEPVVAAGGVAHAVSASVTARMVIRKSMVNGAGMFEGGMWIFYLEVLIVLALGGFIVWWTMPKKKKAQDAGQTRESQRAQAAQKTRESQQAGGAGADTPRDPAGKP